MLNDYIVTFEGSRLIVQIIRDNRLMDPHPEKYESNKQKQRKDRLTDYADRPTDRQT